MPTIIVRSLLGRLGTLAVGAGVVCAVAAVWMSDGAVYGLRALAWGGLLLLAVWALWWAPQLRLGDDALVVRNAWRSHSLAWESVKTCRTRWILEVVTHDGTVVKAPAAQRAGGLSASVRGRREMLRRAGKGAQDTVAGALGHRAIRGEYLDPGEATYRTRLDADAAGDLISAYAARRADHWRLRARQAHRRARLDRKRDSERAEGAGSAEGGTTGSGPAGSGSGSGETAGVRPGRSAGGGVETVRGAADGGASRVEQVRSRTNLLPVVVGCGLLLLLACTQIVAA